MKSKIMCFIAFVFFSINVWAAQTVNINAADAATLDRVLEGIGPKKAQSIVDFRKLNGPYKSLDDLSKVSGIGAKTIARNRDKIRFADEAVKSEMPKAQTQATAPAQ